MAKIRNRKNRKTSIFDLSGNLLDTLGSTRLRDLGAVGLLCWGWIIYTGNEKLLHFLDTRIEQNQVIRQLITDTKRNSDAIENFRQRFE